MSIPQGSKKFLLLNGSIQKETVVPSWSLSLKKIMKCFHMNLPVDMHVPFLIICLSFASEREVGAACWALKSRIPSTASSCLFLPISGATFLTYFMTWIILGNTGWHSNNLDSRGQLSFTLVLGAVITISLIMYLIHNLQHAAYRCLGSNIYF